MQASHQLPPGIFWTCTNTIPWPTPPTGMTCPFNPETMTSANAPSASPNDTPLASTIPSTMIPANALTPTAPSAVTITITATPPLTGDTQETQPVTPNPNPKPKQTPPPTYLQRVAKLLRAKGRASSDNSNSNANDSTLAQCIRFFARDLARDLAWRVLLAMANMARWYLELIRLAFVGRHQLPRRGEGLCRVVWRALVLGAGPECRWLARLVAVLGLGTALVWWMVRVMVGDWWVVVGVLMGAVWEERE